MSDPSNTETIGPNDQSELQAAVALGIDVDTFLRSSSGVHLIERAREAMLDALQRLKELDVFEATREQLAKAQNDVRVPELLIVWLQQAVAGGRDAAAQLHQRDSEPVDPL